jgi:hypothetical protein
VSAGRVSWEGHAGFHTESAIHVPTLRAVGLVHQPSAMQGVVQALLAIQEAVQVLLALLGLAQIPAAARQHLWGIAQEEVALDYAGWRPLVLGV